MQAFWLYLARFKARFCFFFRKKCVHGLHFPNFDRNGSNAPTILCQNVRKTILGVVAGRFFENRTRFGQFLIFLVPKQKYGKSTKNPQKRFFRKKCVRILHFPNFARNASNVPTILYQNVPETILGVVAGRFFKKSDPLWAIFDFFGP